MSIFILIYHRNNRWRKRGIALNPLKYGIGFGIKRINFVRKLIPLIYLSFSMVLAYSILLLSAVYRLYTLETPNPFETDDTSSATHPLQTSPLIRKQDDRLTFLAFFFCRFQ